MSLTVAIQMDPIEAIDLASDTTFVLAEEAMSRGYRLLTYPPGSLTLEGKTLSCRARQVRALRREPGNHVDQASVETLDLSSVDVVLVRQDPPFDMAYVTTTHLLETLPRQTLVVNDPRGIRNSPEKLLVLSFPHVMPPTVVTTEIEVADDFRRRHGDVVLKPVYGHGGNGVFLVGREDPNLAPLLDLLAAREPVILQKFLPGVRERGDRRILLLEGEPLGAIDRFPPKDGIRSNLVAGGSARKAELTDRDKEICRAIAGELRRRGLVFAGIDVIDGQITEINVTSPTGAPAVERHDGIRVGARFWDCVETRLAAVRKPS